MKKNERICRLRIYKETREKRGRVLQWGKRYKSSMGGSCERAGERNDWVGKGRFERGRLEPKSSGD
jgi:hypothetical protein